MSTGSPTTAEPPAPTIHEAEPETGPSGAILWGPVIDLPTAIARRARGLDVVVRGSDVGANRQLAEAIESAVGPCVRSDPHQRAGPMALPHYQPRTRPPAGHTFYETAKRKAKRKR